MISFLLIYLYLCVQKPQNRLTMARPIKENKENKNVIQSYILTTAKYQFSINEKRILYRLIERAQEEIQGTMIKNHLCKMQKNLWSVSIEMPITAILGAISTEGQRNTNYEEVKKAANSLVRKVVEWDDKEGKTWYCTALIYNVKLTKGSGIMKFDVSDWVWDMMLDFSKGFRKYELVTAMKFKSPYTMRFYELMSGQKKPLYLSLQELREMFGVQNKYKHPADLRKCIIEPAKKELDATSPYSFFPKEERDGDKKTSKITGYTFFPVFHEHNQDKKLQKAEQQSKVTARFQLDDTIYEYLHHSFGFQSQEINKNKTTFIEGQNGIPDFIGFLSELKAASRFADNPKGYVINAIKIKTKESAIQKE